MRFLLKFSRFSKALVPFCAVYQPVGSFFPWLWL